MAFISLEFVTFFAVVAGLYFVLPHRFRWMWLLAASAYFYWSLEPRFLLICLAATLVAFVTGLQIEKAPDKARKQTVLWIGLALLIGNFLVFKYTSFFNETLRSMFGWFGLTYAVPEVHILLPIGISFYSFLLIGYLVDVVRGARAERHFGIFSLFTLFFPKLISGPIERSKNLLPQLRAEYKFDYTQTVFGLQLILWGVFKKAVVADRIAPFVNNVYDAPHAADGFMLTLATWMYAFQLYCDFSGYTDIALGVAAILGFKLINNFNRPYFATSIQDFWKRWHISLTSWLTDYVYTPLTRQKFLKVKFYTMMLVGLFITFVVSGFWHGAQWTFVIWGVLHGSYIVGSLLLQKPWNNFARQIGLDKRPQLYRGMKIAVTFSLVCFAYIWFRAATVADAWHISTHLFTGWGDIRQGLRDFVGADLIGFLVSLAGIAIVMAAGVLQGQVDVRATLAKRPVWERWALYYVGAASIALLGVLYHSDHQFIYFSF